MKIVQQVRTGIAGRASAYKNPVYLLYAIIGAALFLVGAFFAEAGVGPIETAIFRTFNDLSDNWNTFFTAISLLGTIGFVPIVALIAAIRRHYANALKILIAGVGAYLTAAQLKLLELRPRPTAIMEEANLRELDADILLGYPSGHMAVAAVLALTAYLYLPKRYHKIITALVILVGISRMYLGVHFPMDLIGGWGIGLVVGGLLNFAFGSRRYSPVAPAKVAAKLEAYGFKEVTAKIASVDARGSVPYIVTTSKHKMFVKIVGLENNVADWLFKIFRRAVYRRLEDEHPYLSPKRQLEHEAYVAMLAKQAGVRTPEIVSIFEPESGRWAMAQEMIPGKSLDSIQKSRITDDVLDEVWRQVKLLHKNNIIHRDLRAANVFLDEDGKPWMIDFGFSEASVSEDSFYRDTIELVASLSLLVGPERAVASANKVIGKKELTACLPYLSTAVLSGATSTAMKKQKKLFKQLRSELEDVTGVKNVKPEKLKRLDAKTFLVVIALGVAIHALAPQFASLDESIDYARQANLVIFLLAVVLSAITYILAGLSYKFLAIYPLRLWPTVIVQVASSFASKVAPAGTGGIALNARYLYRNDHDVIQAGAVAALNTFMGLFGHVTLVIIIAVFSGDSLLELIPEVHITRFMIIVGVFAVITFMLAGVVFPQFRNVFVKGRDKVREQLRFYRSNPSKLFFGYLASIGITLSYASILFLSARSLGVELSLLDVVYVFTVGAIVATVTPTPGGLGGAEAAFIASLTSIGVDSAAAVTITLIYRLLTFWLPILPGFWAFKVATKKEYI